MVSMVILSNCLRLVDLQGFDNVMTKLSSARGQRVFYNDKTRRNVSSKKSFRHLVRILFFIPEKAYIHLSELGLNFVSLISLYLYLNVALSLQFLLKDAKLVKFNFHEERSRA